ncbi:hypothetical protein EMCRGX_G022649 [Ephydatia muelleri]
MDFAELAKSFQDAISAIDAAGQVLDLRLVPLLQAISQNLRHLLKDFRSRRPVATPRVASAAATAVHITPTSPATMEGSPIGEPINSISAYTRTALSVTATRFFQALNSDDLNDASNSTPIAIDIRPVSSTSINSPADTNITPARNDSPTASNSFEATPSSVHEPMIDRPSQRGGKRRRCVRRALGRAAHHLSAGIREDQRTAGVRTPRQKQPCRSISTGACTLPTVLRRGKHGPCKPLHIASRSFADSVMLAGPYPNTLKRVAYNLEIDQSLVTLGMWQRQLTILMGMGVPSMWTGSRAFAVTSKEALHDAIELGHQYSVSVVGGNTLPGPSNAPPQTMVQPFGYHDLVHARCEIGRPTCGRVLLVPCGVHHGHSGDRLLAELYTCSEALAILCQVA